MHFSINRDSSLPPYLQLKEQIKFAYTMGQLKQGDVLPSIRAMASELGIGEAAVRRAYSELRILGFLSSEQRKAVSVQRRVAPPTDMAALANEATVQGRRLLAWGRERGLSPVSLARLTLRQAIGEDERRPSYVYVDASTGAALETARTIAQAWEIHVAGISIDAFAALSREEVRRFLAVLVNSYRYESLLEANDGLRPRQVFSIKLQLAARLVHRIRRLPAGARILLVFADADYRRASISVVESYKELIGPKWHYVPTAAGEIPDLAAVASDGRFKMVIVSPHIWHQVPERAKRMPNVVRVRNEVDLQAMEEVRIAAGVLL